MQIIIAPLDNNQIMLNEQAGGEITTFFNNNHTAASNGCVEKELLSTSNIKEQPISGTDQTLNQGE